MKKNMGGKKNNKLEEIFHKTHKKSMLRINFDTVS